MAIVRWIAVIYLFCLAAFGVGVFVGTYKVWPYYLIQEVSRFVRGSLDEDTSLMDKVLNDAGIRPNRYLYDYTPYKPERFRTLTGLGVRDRRTDPVVFASPDMPDGYIYVAAKFDLESGMNAVLLLNSKGEIVHVWPGVEKHGTGKLESYHLLHVGRDGSIVHGADYGDLFKLDRCSNVLWKRKGDYHHSVTVNGDGDYWVTGSDAERDAVTLVDAETGDVKKTILLADIHEASQLSTQVFSLHVHDRGDDPFHNNDVDALTPDIAAAFPGFKAGDLGISYRHGNIVYVIDQDTLQLKWHAQQKTFAQHDIDWHADGTWTVFNNRTTYDDYSDIVRFRPGSDKPEVVFSGATHEFSSTAAAGEHQFYDNGLLMVQSMPQGRVLIVNDKGEGVFEFVNMYSDDEALSVWNAGYLPADYFNVDMSAPCDR